MRARVIPAVLALFAGGAHAGALDISLSDDTAYLVYLIDSGSLGYGGADIGFGFFYTEEDAGREAGKPIPPRSNIVPQPMRLVSDPTPDPLARAPFLHRNLSASTR